MTIVFFYYSSLLVESKTQEFYWSKKSANTVQSYVCLDFKVENHGNEQTTKSEV